MILVTHFFRTAYSEDFFFIGLKSTKLNEKMKSVNLLGFNWRPLGALGLNMSLIWLSVEPMVPWVLKFKDMFLEFSPLLTTEWLTAKWKLLIPRPYFGDSRYICGEKVWRIGAIAVFLGDLTEYPPLFPISSIFNA